MLKNAKTLDRSKPRQSPEQPDKPRITTRKEVTLEKGVCVSTLAVDGEGSEPAMADDPEDAKETA